MKISRQKICILICLAPVICVVGTLLFWPLPQTVEHHVDGVSLQITDRRGVLLQERLIGEGGRGKWATLEEISPHVIDATVAVEDHRFFRHPGVDPLALSRAIWQAVVARRIVSGASTITQQLARRIYRLPREWWAKPLEWLFALRLEIVLSKGEILEQYLNRVPYGNQAVGIEGAAQLYFDKPVLHLSLAEAAFLAGLPQSPTRYDPYRHPEAAQSRQTHVLNLMRRRGMIDDAVYARAVSTNLELVPVLRVFRAPHFCDWVCCHLDLDESRGGATATTLDWSLQQSLEILVKGHVKRLDAENVTNAAALVMDNATGEILTMVGSADYFDGNHDGQVNGCLALRQPGSALKPFTYGLALERGRTASDILPDIETHAVTEGGDFRVQNYDRTFHGPVRLRTALACSYNVPAVRVLEEMGADLLLQRLRLAGFASLDKPPVYYGLGLTLGNGEVTLLELTRAYCALANQGVLRKERVFLDEEPGQSTERVESDAGVDTGIFSPQVAYLITHILADPEARVPAFGESCPLALPFPCAAKTGTSKDFRDNWTVGYTNEYTVGVWVGNFDGEAMRKVSGISGAGPLFRDIMLLLHREHSPGEFTRPPGLMEACVCSRSGKLPGPHCPGTIDELFIAGTEPTERCDVHRAIYVDRKTRVMASENAPRESLEKHVYEVWPPLYQPWAAGVGLPVPPSIPQRSTETEAKVGFPERVSRAEVVITFPDNGDVYKIDPILREEFQTLELEVVVPEGIDTIAWLVDGELYCRARKPFTTHWQLVQGKHVFEVRADGPAEAVSSAPVSILVL